MHADVQLILLAWEGYKEDREELERIMFGANGHHLPAPPPRDEEWMVGDPPPLARKMRAILRAHDKAYRAEQAERRAGAMQTVPRKLPRDS